VKWISYSIKKSNNNIKRGASLIGKKRKESKKKRNFSKNSLKTTILMLLSINPLLRSFLPPI